MKLSLSVALLLSSSVLFAKDPAKRITESAQIFNEIMGAKDKAIPAEFLEKAKCVGIIPNLKRAGFVVGAKYGKGIVVCRQANALGWSAPGNFRVEGGSIGLQIGAGETDLVFIVMNERGMDKLLKDKFTIGADASAMAGPVGRSVEAKTDAMMHAEILSYSRSRGVFGGITLEGATMRPDNDDNTALYGREVKSEDILKGKVKAPDVAKPLYTELNRYVPTKKAAR